MSNQSRHQKGAPASQGGKFAKHDRDGGTCTIEAAKYSASGLTTPDGWAGEYPLTPARQWLDDRMQGGEHLANPDPIGARCDYAEVGEEGIAYGYQISPELIGTIVAGDRGHDEGESDYADRVNEALTREDLAAIDEFFTREYGADQVQDGDYGHIALEFYVEYGPEGLDGTSVEQMGDRAESETKLLQARNDWEYGGRMQSKLAQKLGFDTETIRDRNGDWSGTRYVRAAAETEESHS